MCTLTCPSKRACLFPRMLGWCLPKLNLSSLPFFIYCACCFVCEDVSARNCFWGQEKGGEGKGAFFFFFWDIFPLLFGFGCH